MPVLNKGKEYRVGRDSKGRDIVLKLYPINVLAEALTKTLDKPRTTQTIRKWEKTGVIPPATFRKNKTYRLYAQEQIDCICKVAKECKISQGNAVSMTNFSMRLREELKIVNDKLLGKK